MTDRFLWRHWPDGSVVYDRQEGSTRAVSSLLSAVHEALRKDPSLGDDALVNNLSAAHPEPDLRASVAEARELLAGSGLL